MINMEKTFWAKNINNESKNQLPPKSIILESDQDWKIIEVGCGTGRVLKYIREVGFIGELYGIDWSMDLLIAAKEKILDARFVEGNILNIPFKNSHFDLAILSATLTCIIDHDELLKVLKEVHRILKVESKLYISDFLITYNLKNIFRYLIGLFKYKKFGVFGAGYQFIHYNEDEIKKYIEEAGFTIIQFNAFKTKTWNNNTHNGFEVICKKLAGVGKCERQHRHAPGLLAKQQDHRRERATG